MDASEKTSRGTCDKYIEVINELEKLDEVIKTPRYRMCCNGILNFLKAVCYYVKNVKRSKD